MKIRCLIVDDVPIAQQILEKYIAQIEVLELANKCNNTCVNNVCFILVHA